MIWQRDEDARGYRSILQDYDKFDLNISTKKPEAVYHQAPGKPYNEPTIIVNGHRLHVVDKVTYIRSTLSRAVHIDDEFTARFAKASVVFGRLSEAKKPLIDPSPFVSRKKTPIDQMARQESWREQGCKACILVWS